MNIYTLVADEVSVTRRTFTSGGPDPTVCVIYDFRWQNGTYEQFYEWFGDWYNKADNTPVSPESHPKHFRFIDLVDNAYWNQDCSDELDGYYGGP